MSADFIPDDATRDTTESNRRGVPYDDGSKAIISNVLQVTPLCGYFTGGDNSVGTQNVRVLHIYQNYSRVVKRCVIDD